MEETRKRDGSDEDETTMKRSKQAITDSSVDFGDDIVAWLSMDNDDTDTVDELMKFLDTDADGVSITSSSSTTSSNCIGTGSKVKFIENPYSSLLIFQSSSSYITINGNEESCGSSFSDWESSLMASVDMSGINMNAGKTDDIDGFCEWFQGGKGGGAWGSNEVEEARGFIVTEEDGGGGERLMEGGVDWDWKDEGFFLTTM